MRFTEQLQESLSTLPLRDKTTQVVNGDAYKCLVFVVSPQFEGMDEAERQSLVWGHLSEKFSWDELSQIEFIFTDSPSERMIAESN